MELTWREELAWAAGFFDGEGHIRWHTSRRSTPELSKRKGVVRQMMLNISQKDRRPLERFMRVVGVGNIVGPYKSNKGGMYWRYNAQSYESAQAIAAMLWAFLSGPKREQVASVLAAGKARYRRAA